MKLLFLYLFILLNTQLQAQDFSFAVMADTQKTLGVERILLGRETNQRESQILIEALAKEPIQFVAMLGDFVSWGASGKDWNYFDQLISPLKKSQIPISPAVGNHDYFGKQSKALKNFYQRFPELKQSHWYLKKQSHLALIFLDSNRKDLGKKAWEEQKIWLQKTVAELDLDTNVKGIFLLAHHPPYTNSKASGDEKDVQESFLPSLQSSKKGLAYISGHAHGYEHFLKQNLHYIVTGGGGGPRVRYLEGKKARHQDLFQATGRRPFNYLVLQPNENGVLVKVKGLKKNESSVESIDEFIISYRF